MSSLLFKAVLEDVFEKIKGKWEETKQIGVQLGHASHTRLTNLRFADDVLLVASNLRQLMIMLTDFHDNAPGYGSNLHPDKKNTLS